MALCVYAGAACSTGNTVDPGTHPCAEALAIRPEPGFLTVAEEADIAARVLPGGFGGLFVDISSDRSVKVVAFFKDLSLSDGARGGLGDLLACGGAYPGWVGPLVPDSHRNISLRQGQYTGTELLSYLRTLGFLKQDPAVWALEVDPETNRIWIGLLDGSQMARIQQAIAARSVPLGATTIEPPAPSTGTEPFVVLNSPVSTGSVSEPFGTMFFSLRVRYTNRQVGTRYPDWCVDPDFDQFTTYFDHTIEKWDGSQWRLVKQPFCVMVLQAPRAVGPGEMATDSVPVAASRRLNTQPFWFTGRLTGTYRFVGKVYMSTSSSPPFITNLAPLEEQVSAPFRLINTLPF
jgi:hypothetical protein